MVEKSSELANITYKYISERVNIPETLQAIENDPGILQQLEEEVDLTIASLNTYLAHGVPADAEKLLPNTLRLREKVSEKGFQLPLLRELKQTPISFHSLCVRAGIRTLREVARKMEKGEHPEPPEDAWKFHTDINLTPGGLTAALMLEIYGQYAEKLFTKLKLKGFNDILLPLEEVLAQQHNNLWLFQLVRQWYTTEEGFSRQLVDYAASVPRKITQIPERDRELLNELSRRVDTLADFRPGSPDHIEAIRALSRFALKLTNRYDLQREDLFNWRNFITKIPRT